MIDEAQTLEVLKLPDELVEEILLRLPPDDPALLDCVRRLTLRHAEAVAAIADEDTRLEVYLRLARVDAADAVDLLPGLVTTLPGSVNTPASPSWRARTPGWAATSSKE